MVDFIEKNKQATNQHRFLTFTTPIELRSKNNSPSDALRLTPGSFYKDTLAKIQMRGKDMLGPLDALESVIKSNSNRPLICFSLEDES
jgi:hypothetical protein